MFVWLSFETESNNMNFSITENHPLQLIKSSTKQVIKLRSFLAGAFFSLGFAPFHYPGLAILGIALFFATLWQINIKKMPFKLQLKQSFLTGLLFGLGVFSVGVSWVLISIHNYGHLNYPFSIFITTLFIGYLAFFFALMAFLFKLLIRSNSQIAACILFSSLWCLCEYMRATVMSGFPWLLLGTGQIDTPLRHLLPIIGIYGVSFISCFAACCLSSGSNLLITSEKKLTASAWIIGFVLIFISPEILKNKRWTQLDSTRLSVAVIQANLSMRDKWDEALFWQLINIYQTNINQLLGHKKLIVLPESAIPIPASYISNTLDDINSQAASAGSAILFGIPQNNVSSDYNTMASMGMAHGVYFKQHLVPFGEFIPKPFEKIVDMLSIPVANLSPGPEKQRLIRVDNHPIASLICYELAYPWLLKNQLPAAEWIVSISDDGWFGHSLAMYQQLQMAQVLSLLTGRFQVVANNDGLSAVINSEGYIENSLPAQSFGILDASIQAAKGQTPWTRWGDKPCLMVCFIVVGLFAGYLLFKARDKTRALVAVVT